MKKLGKLKLHDAAIMNDHEMKSVMGGYEDAKKKCKPIGSQCSGTCWHEDKKGECKWKDYSEAAGVPLALCTCVI